MADVVRPFAKEKPLALTWGNIVVKSMERKYFPRIPGYGPFQKCNGILGTSLFLINFIGQDVNYEDAEIALCDLRGRKLNF